ncbi:hypothetical protein [Streptomyces chumphonensis]|uniref:hypothetical protein n=1 Tax=Streptomyces chumphonensis TaxID=1214925 RepID=UPI003D714490
MEMSPDGPRPGPPAGPEGEALPCGRALEDLWDAWESDPAAAAAEPHARQCPHCAAALADLRTLDDLVRDELARAEDASAREGDALASGVTARVMDIVRTELRPGAAVPLGEPEEDAWIVETAAARTFRSAAEAVPGVRAGSCRIVPLGATQRRFRFPGARLPRGPVRVLLDVTAPPGLERPVPELADAVRQRVTTAARGELGMDVHAVDVTVVDLADPADTSGLTGTASPEGSPARPAGVVQQPPEGSDD